MMKNIVKKVLLMVLSLIMVLSLCQCKSSDGGSTNDDNSTDEGSSVIGTTSGENGNTTISTTSPTTPTTSITTNSNEKHTITVTYEWHPGLPDVEVFYDLEVRVDGAATNAKNFEISTKTKGVKISGTRVTIPYSVRKAGKSIVVTTKHVSGVSCDVTIPTYNWTQTFSDEFNGTDLDRTKWGEHNMLTNVEPSDVDTYEVIDRAKVAKDCFEVKDGKLYMLIKDEPTYDTKKKIKYLYSECCLDTKGKFEQTYGLFQANIATAKFGGINTAFWLTPSNYSKKYTHYKTESPQLGLGEIDILESSVAFGNKDRRTFCITEHFWDYTDNYKLTSNSKYYKVSDTITNPHTYSCIWTPDALYYYLDKELVRATTGLQSTGLDGKENSPVFILIDVALYLDNAWVGKRDFTAADLPIAGTVDWVRAYKYN